MPTRSAVESAKMEASYLNTHREKLEGAMGAAVQAAMDAGPEDPLSFMAEHLSAAAYAQSGGMRAAAAAAKLVEDAHAASDGLGLEPNLGEQGWSVEGWLRSLGLLDVLKAAIIRPLEATGGNTRQQLDYLCALGASTHEVFLALLSADSVLGPLAHALARGATQLAKSSNASAQEGSGKFQAEGFSLSYGSLKT
jgi:hypothetical protein